MHSRWGGGRGAERVPARLSGPLMSATRITSFGIRRFCLAAQDELLSLTLSRKGVFDCMELWEFDAVVVLLFLEISLIFGSHSGVKYLQKTNNFLILFFIHLECWSHHYWINDNMFTSVSLDRVPFDGKNLAHNQWSHDHPCEFGQGFQWLWSGSHLAIETIPDHPRLGILGKKVWQKFGKRFAECLPNLLFGEPKSGNILLADLRSHSSHTYDFSDIRSLAIK